VIALHRILVPIDFSEGSHAAFETALALAMNFGASLTLFHVHHLPAAVFPDVILPIAPELMRSIEHTVQLSLGEIAARGRAASVACDTMTAIGTIHFEICALAERIHADLIVIGTHGRTGLSHAVLGSVAEKVVRRAPCPVLTVRQRAHSFVHAAE
jgi:nucleotide-binding universal stress UspA family protein